jgi:hypothetical protein
LAGALGRARAGGGESEQGGIAAELFELEAAGGAGGEVGVEADAIFSVQRVERVESEIVSVLFVPGHLCLKRFMFETLFAGR